MSEVLAFDIGGTHLRSALIDADYGISHFQSEDISDLDFKDIYERAYEIARMYRQRGTNYVGVGMSLAGQVNHAEGTVAYHSVKSASESASGWSYETLPVVQAMQAASEAPCAIENDGNAVVLAEWQVGSAKGVDNVVSMNLGTYSASGVVLNGELVRRQTSGLLLGAYLTEDNGEISFANAGFTGMGFKRMLEQHVQQHPESTLSRGHNGAISAGEYIFAMAQQGDTDALGMYAHASRHLGMHLTSILNICDPEVLTVGGKIMDAETFIMPKVPEIANTYGLPSIHGGSPSDKIIKATHLYDGGLIGAAVAARMSSN